MSLISRFFPFTVFPLFSKLHFSHTYLILLGYCYLGINTYYRVGVFPFFLLSLSILFSLFLLPSFVHYFCKDVLIVFGYPLAVGSKQCESVEESHE